MGTKFGLRARLKHAILELEDQIGRRLPNSLKNFLQKFGGLGIYDNFISGVLSDNPLEMSGGYIYADTKFLRDDYPELPGSFWVLKKHEGGAYCLDVESPTFGDEYAIVNFDSGSSSQAARDFESFVKDVFLYGWSDAFA